MLQKEKINLKRNKESFCYKILQAVPDYWFDQELEVLSSESLLMLEPLEVKNFFQHFLSR